MMIDLSLVLIVIICGIVAICASYRRHVRQSSGFDADTRNKRVLFVTSHPDDECMFFAPTILSLSLGGQYDVFLLCLSSGNFYGQGRTRQQELVNSGKILGIRESNIFILDRRELADDPNVVWDTFLISRLLADYVKEYYIDLIFTFDEYGVSGHANHRSVYAGVRQFLSGSDCPAGVEGYKLVSINVLRKYISILELGISYCTSNFIFISHWTDFWKAQKAMYAHKSQLVWFRSLYILFSRYMVVNTYDKITADKTLIKQNSVGRQHSRTE